MIIGGQFSLGKKRKNSDCNVRNVTRILFGMNPDQLVFKVLIFTNDYKIWIRVNEYYILVDISAQILLTFFFLLLSPYQYLSQMFSLWYKYWWKISIYPKKGTMKKKDDEQTLRWNVYY